MDTLTSIRAFARTVELGSLTAAAADLGISTAMVSKHLKYLETLVSTRLMQRTTRSICLTEEGRICYDHYRKALDEIDRVKEIFELSRGSPSGTLRIATPNYIGEHYLQPIIAAYVRQHPNMKLDVVLSDERSDLVEGALDMALWVAESLPPSLIARQLARVDHVIVASPQYLEREGRPTTANDLCRHMILALSSNGSQWSLVERDRRMDLTFERYMLLDSRYAYRLVLDGVGIAMLPTCMVEEHLRTGRLESLLRSCQLPERHLYAVYPSRRHLAPKVRAFIDLVAEALRHSTTPQREVRLEEIEADARIGEAQLVRFA